MSLYPLSSNDVDPLYCEPYIINGFRRSNEAWIYYFKSLLHKHNETINVWSHLLGTIYIIILFIYYNKQLNFFSNAHARPFAISLLSAMIMFICSATAHLLHAKSEMVHMTCFLIDFVGVSLHGFGSGFLHIYYSAPQWYYDLVKESYVYVLVILAIVVCYFNCYAQYKYKRPYPAPKRFYQFFPCGVLYFYSIMPIFLRIYETLSMLEQHETTIHLSYKDDFGLYCHLIQIVAFIFGSIVFGFDLPQRFCPGHLCFFGQGHHLFHFSIYFVVTFQMHGVLWDYEKLNQDLISQRREPHVLFCAGSMLILIVTNLIIVACFRRKTVQNKCVKTD
ncbi:unnamed protein product [Didymodactylos carnosus]|uniref:Uncharacterized protein n=1 Tax=Didymodactylos carnosus TaxID=1234261 RepID=A0A815BVJ2_9BILA|nr:unnamed protein product [Didymodactylos carnosus]CAF1276958.1 unnamed protein product [Didymodactylos carnosus]CAF3733154.1 unnamed protein product [Didymodactylos carnosus]CAF4069218.1 unnamed protein product [Didymodactylos carnosus]